MVFLILFFVPGLVALCFYLFGGTRITPKELVLMMGIQAAVAGISAGIIYWSNTHDVEIWNGRVTDKQSERVTCAHPYCCAWTTYTYKCGKSTCTGTKCSRWCKHHPYDVDWTVYTSLKERLEISRIDWQGVNEPPRWTQVVIGEPSSTEHSYENYIKAAPDSLFRRTKRDIAKMPLYPDKVFDYYRSNSMFTYGLSIDNIKDWNADLNEVNAQLGQNKQVNVTMVVVKNQPHDYFYDLEHAWIGGKKNDFIVVASVDENLRYQWVAVMSWTKNEMSKIVVRDELMLQGVLDRQQAVPVIAQAVNEHYVRREMKDFEYLKSSITPSATGWTVSLLIGLILQIALGIFCHKHDLFNEERPYRRW